MKVVSMYYYFCVVGHDLEAVNDEVKLAWNSAPTSVLDRLATEISMCKSGPMINEESRALFKM
jgi:hypothetical protein